MAEELYFVYNITSNIAVSSRPKPYDAAVEHLKRVTKENAARVNGKRVFGLVPVKVVAVAKANLVCEVRFKIPTPTPKTCVCVKQKEVKANPDWIEEFLTHYEGGK